MQINLKVLGAALLALALAACNHHDDSTSATPATTPADAYTTAVSGVVNGPDAASETAAPVAVTGLTPTVSETSQPVPVNTN